MRLLNVKTLEIEEISHSQIPDYAILSHTWGSDADEVSFQDFQSAPRPTRYKMRLLNAKTLKVEEFFGHQIPPYTILSHTWDKDEVSFGDMQSSNFKNKKGFAKIWYACNQTREDGWEYTWIDTCCIDKTSSAELSEAINSMFQWYRDAQVCYAYLADVLEGSGHYGAEIPDAPLEKSRWFTRGWTLQELIAPREVIFYGTEWRPLGRKHEMATELHGITGIDQFVLKIRDGRLLERALEETCAARKMSWASKRETTRPEDIAYCLLGLFGINMPLLYGEGMKAFTRLQQEIARVSNDQTLLAWGFPAEPGKKSRNDATTGPRVFAHDPSYFASAGTVVRHDINGDSFRPWTLTNLGIGLEVAVLRDNWPATCVAILSCHYEDDMRGPIGLRLERFRTGAAQRNDTFAPRSHWPRLIVLDEDEVSDKIAEPIHIVDRQTFFTPIRLAGGGVDAALDPMAWLYAQTNKFFVTVRGNAVDKYTAVEYFPPAYWNRHGMTVCFPENSSSATSSSTVKQAAIRFDHRDRPEEQVIFSFGSQIAGFASSPWVHIGDDDAGVSLEEHCSHLASSFVRTGLSSRELKTVSATIDHRMRMGEPCFVVAVSFEDMAAQ